MDPTLQGPGQQTQQQPMTPDQVAMIQALQQSANSGQNQQQASGMGMGNPGLLSQMGMVNSGGMGPPPMQAQAPLIQPPDPASMTGGLGSAAGPAPTPPQGAMGGDPALAALMLGKIPGGQ